MVKRFSQLKFECFAACDCSVYRPVIIPVTLQFSVLYVCSEYSYDYVHTRLAIISCITLEKLSLEIDMLFVELLQHRVSETGPTPPSTGIAAHAIDEDVEVVEVDDKFQAAAAGAGMEAPLRTPRLPFPPPPPPPIPQNVYSQVS